MSLFSHYPSEGARVRFTQTRLLCIQFNYSLVRSWRRYDNLLLDIGRVLFFSHFYEPRRSWGLWKWWKKKTNTRLISNHHDRTSLVNNGFITRQLLLTKLVQSWWLVRSWRRYDSWILDIGRVLFFPHLFALSRSKYDWFISRAKKESNCVCGTTQHESPLCFLCFDSFLQLFATSSLTLSKNYELCKFARDQSGKSWTGKRDPSLSLG